MGEPHVISALVRKRAELSGQALTSGHAKAEAIAVQIDHVDAVLALFGYNGDPRDIKPKRKHVYLFKRMELPRLIRQIGAGGTNRNIALSIMALKGWDTGDRRLVAKVADAVKSQKGWQRRRHGANYSGCIS